MEKFAKFYVWWLENMPIYCVALTLLIALVIFCKEAFDDEFSWEDLPEIFSCYIFIPIFAGVALGVFAPIFLPPILIYCVVYLIIKLIKKKESE